MRCALLVGIVRTYTYCSYSDPINSRIDSSHFSFFHLPTLYEKYYIEQKNISFDILWFCLNINLRTSSCKRNLNILLIRFVLRGEKMAVEYDSCTSSASALTAALSIKRDQICKNVRFVCRFHCLFDYIFIQFDKHVHITFPARFT